MPGLAHRPGGGDLDPQPPVGSQPPIDAGMTNTGGVPPGGGPENWTADPSDPLKAQTIYFDYDKSPIKASEQGKLEELCDYSKRQGGVGLRKAGDCDKRR